MKIEVELTEAEVRYLSTRCILRIVKSAIGAIPEDYEYFEDLHDLGEYMEPLRFKLVAAIVKAKRG